MVYGTDPFSAQNATNDSNSSPSIFGALPYPGSASSVDPALNTLVTLRFTSLNPTILDCGVVGPNNETYYRVVTNGQGFTLLKNAAGQNTALIEWRSHPTVEAQTVGAKQPVGQWLQLSPDRRYVSTRVLSSGSYSWPVFTDRYRTMIYGRVHYAWAPTGRFLHVCPRVTSVPVAFFLTPPLFSLP